MPFLSMAGRVTMIKLVLSMMSMHMIQVMALPYSVVMQLTRKLGTLFGEDQQGKKGVHLISWN